MKKSLLLIIAVIIFLIGVVFKFISLPLSGALTALGLVLFIIYVNVMYVKKGKWSFKDIMIISLSVIASAIIFSIIQHRVFFEILIGTIILGFITFLIINKIKKNKKQ